MVSEKPVTDFPKCQNCQFRSCLLTIDQVLEKTYVRQEKEKKIRNFIYGKLPKSVFLPAINFHHRITGKRIIKYEKIEGGWAIQYDDFVLNSPRPQWINSTTARFREEFETFYRIMPGDTCVDVGACIGDTTLPILSEAGEKAKVYAVEPMPDNVKFLKVNLGKYPNAEILINAVSDKNGKMKFYLHDTPTGHSLAYFEGRDYGVIEVEALTLNEMFKGKKIDFVKIDVQGYESHILGGQKQFYENIDKLVIETHARWTPELATYPACLRILKNEPLDVRFCIVDGVIHCRGGLKNKK